MPRYLHGEELRSAYRNASKLRKGGRGGKHKRKRRGKKELSERGRLTCKRAAERPPILMTFSALIPAFAGIVFLSERKKNHSFSRNRCRNNSPALEKTVYFFQAISRWDSRRGAKGRKQRSLSPVVLTSLSRQTA